jgi:hypothetical protein|tara:strand:+ start:1012 stop:1200 length:189 start_codon:yes stop_codon:yes gene_type:complete
MNKEALAELIDAYADAKASNNKLLIQTMIKQLEVTLDLLFKDEQQAPQGETGGVDITEEGTY